MVCNAGGFFDAPLLEMMTGTFDKTFDFNVRAPFFLAQAFALHQVQHKRGGSIILVSSTNGLQSEPDSNAYDASKGAISPDKSPVVDGGLTASQIGPL